MDQLVVRRPAITQFSLPGNGIFGTRCGKTTCPRLCQTHALCSAALVLLKPSFLSGGSGFGEGEMGGGGGGGEG